METEGLVIKRIFLSGKSLKGKNRIKEQGSEFELIRTEDNVLFSSMSGPWLLLQSVKSPDKIRWVHLINDPHFKIEQKVC